MNTSSIKLIIWDLDETLWSGTLSDGDISMPSEYVELIHNLVDAGVMCSICSKNDEETAKRALANYGIWDLFVFTSINWTPKGERIKQIITEMGLRDVNVLFIDDNPSNRGEAKDYCKGLMVEDVDVIPGLIQFFTEMPKKDKAHTRLKQYKILETKMSFKAKTSSNEEFLYKSDIRLAIWHDCQEHLDRISDLILRSNQLNFTKKRIGKEELELLLNDKDVECGYVTVKDAFGDYGIVGFYALKDKSLIHFVFSCRTLNMGVEQYVYHVLGTPNITVIGDVASDLLSCDPKWINQQKDQVFSEKKARVNQKIVLKGPCDISQLFSYLKDDGTRIIKEFSYVNDRGISIEGRNHTYHILQHNIVSATDLDRLQHELPFFDALMYKTRMFDSDVDIVVLSLFTDPNLGLYEEKKSGIIVAFGEWVNDLTDESRWEEYIHNEDSHIFLANWHPTRHELETIKSKFGFLGRISPERLFENVKVIHGELSQDKRLYICLGSETPYKKNNMKAYSDRHEYNFKVNSLVREWAKTQKNVFLLDFNSFIKGQDDFTNNINHFQRIVYYRMFQEFMATLGEKKKGFKEKSFFAEEIRYKIVDTVRTFYHLLFRN